MNSVYRLIWSRRHNIFIAAPEHARSSGKASGLKAISAAVLSAISFSAQALPETGVVSPGTGTGTITISDKTLTVNQVTEKLAITWQKFSTATGETVEFKQPSTQSIVLNRVIGTEQSSLMGNMTANGQVWLLNPNGVLIGPEATVNVGGLLATSLFISDSDFITGKKIFKEGSGKSVINQGKVTVGEGGNYGYAALIGGSVSNEGTITARLGTIVLAGGSEVTLDFSGDKLLSARVDKGVVNALVQNKQLISADGGIVIMTAQGVNALLSTVVNNEGTIEARTLEGKKGRMSLLGGSGGGITAVKGKLDASVIGTGDGGLIEISGMQVKIADAAVLTTAASSGANGQLQITATDFTINPKDKSTLSGMSADALKANLGRQNVSIKTDKFGSDTSGVININDAVSWSANNKLELNAASDLNLNGQISNSGATAALALRAEQKININANITAAGANTALSITPGIDTNGGYRLNNGATISLPSGAGLTIAGEAYKVITTLTELQGMNDNLELNYALGSDIDASSTATQNGGAGFLPIGAADVEKPFKGNFDGLGHQINKLTINRPSTDLVGLFGGTNFNINNDKQTLRNVSLVDISITGNNYVGGLIANSYSDIDNVYISGAIEGNKFVGGLIGIKYRGSTKNVSTNVNIKANSYGGGIAGLIISGLLDGGSTSGMVNVTEEYAGGLVGLLFDTPAVLNNVSASGIVKGNNYVGGLVGANFGVITNGVVNSKITAMTDAVGLIAGKNRRGISYIYASGTIETQGTSSSDLLVGDNDRILVTSKLLTTDQLKQKENFPGLDFNNVWRIYDGNTAPLLRAFLKPVTVSADSASKNYDKNPYMGAVTGINYSVAGAVLEGSLSYGGTTQPLVNAGSYAIDGLWSTTYDISYGSGKLTILPKTLTASLAATPTKIYDGNTLANVELKDLSLAGLVGDDKITSKKNTVDGVYNSINVNEAKKVEVALNDNAFTAESGTLLSNYKLIVDGTITTRKLLVQAKPVTKSYDGIAFSEPELTYNGFAGNDTQAVMNGTPSYGGNALGAKNAGNYIITVGGLSSANYDVGFESATLTINPKLLIASNNSQPSKKYDGKTNATIILNNFKLTGLVGSEQIGAQGDILTGLYDNKDVSDKNPVSIAMDSSNFKFTNGALEANYKISAINGVITPVGLKISANNDKKIYDGQAYSGGNGVTYSDFVNGETIADLQGQLAYIGNAQGAINAGNYVITPAGFSSNNYAITYTPGELTLQPKTLTASIVSAPSKIYDGNADAKVELSNLQLVGLIKGDVITAKRNKLDGLYSSKNAGDNIPVAIGLNTDNFDFSPGTLPANYQLLLTSGQILPAALSIKVSNVTKNYDGLVYEGKNSVAYSGFAEGETASVLSGSLAYAGTAQAAKNVGLYSITASGLSSTNYKIDFNSGLLKIEPRVLIASIASTPVKVYDGNANASVELSSLQLSNFVNNELITANNKKLPGLYNSKNVNEANAVNIALTSDNFSVSEGTLLSNYILQSNSGKITPAKLTVQSKNIFKSFDGLTYSGADLNYIGFVNGESPADLNGVLTFGGTAQGVKNPGRYTITAAGLGSSNYKIDYLSGLLSIAPDIFSISTLGFSAKAFAGKPGPANSQYRLLQIGINSDPNLKIECRQLFTINFENSSCAGSANGAANIFSPPLPVVSNFCKSCQPQSISVASSDSSIH